MRFSFFYLTSVLAAVEALTITSPSEGQTLDPTEPITFSWTSDSSDPSTFNIVLDNSASGGLTDNVVVATDVSTSLGSYIISTSAAKTYGDGFILKAESTTGDVLATSPTFSLAMGTGTGTSQTFTGTVSEGPASATGVAASASATSNDNTATATTGAQATLGGSSDSSTAGSASSTTGSNSFTTSTVSRSGSSTGTSSSSSPSATTSQNAQPKLGSRSQYAFTAAGLIAGLAALLA